MMKSKNEGRVFAMKNGGLKVFSDLQWQSGIPQKVGWVECGNPNAIAEIETEKVDIETVEIPDDEVVKENTKKEKAEEPSLDYVKQYLYGLADKGKIKKPHHATGEKKLRQLYHENYKQEE